MKNARQLKILELIDKSPIETQEELLEKLSEHGFKTTQATISRDIKELRLIKTASPQGRQIYSVNPQTSPGFTGRVHTVFRQSVTAIDAVQFMIVIHTLPAMAQGAALAIDALEWPEIAGTIAGDDTIFIALFDPSMAQKVADRFRKLTE